MNILSSTTTLINNVLTARTERIAQDLGSEETVDLRQPQPSMPVDKVELSKEYEQMKKLEEMAANAPRINWENHTYQGQKIPDTWHKEPTLEMVSGEQPFSVAQNFSGETFYIEQKLPPKEQVVVNNYEYIQNSLQQIDRARNLSNAYDSVKQENGKIPDPHAQMVLGINVKNKEANLQQFLENMVLGYDMLGIDLTETRGQMLKLSNGTFDLAELLSKYFS